MKINNTILIFNLKEMGFSFYEKKARISISNFSRGSYAVQLYPGLRLISLNSGYCETSNL